MQPRYSWPLPALSHWEVKVGRTSMKEGRGTGFAGSASPFLGWERAAVEVFLLNKSNKIAVPCRAITHHLSLSLSVDV